MKFTVSKDTEVILDGKRYLLENGDKITINEWGDRSSTFGEVLEYYKLPPPPGSEHLLDRTLWHHEYNSTWLGDDPKIELSHPGLFGYPGRVLIGRDRWMFIDGNWEKHDWEKLKELREKEKNPNYGGFGSSDLLRHLAANSPRSPHR